MSSGELDGFLTARLVEVDSELKALEGRRAELLIAIERLEQEGRGVANTLRARGVIFDDGVPERFDSRPEAAGLLARDRARRGSRAGTVQSAGGGNRQGRKPQVRHVDMVRWCREILSEASGPMHVSEIADALEDGGARGYQLPGRGTTANVSVHLTQEEEVFEGAGPKGMWRLRADGDAVRAQG